MLNELLQAANSNQSEVAMLAMHYAITLADAGQADVVHTRAAERGPLFDGMPGLAVKLFLVDRAAPCYATFYLWRDADAARGFIEGHLFDALCEAFGRPEVQLLLTPATDLPFATGSSLRLQRRFQDDGKALVRALDPRDGDVIALASEAAEGRLFTVMYRAVGSTE